MPKADVGTSVQAIKCLQKNREFLYWGVDLQTKRTRERFTADRWLDENEREWYALDRLVRSRPWATNKDTAFEYPFRKATEGMRKAEGAWVGDDQYRPTPSRGPAPCDVVTQVASPPMYPPAYRALLFTPEFGSDQSFELDNWSFLQPEDAFDIWVICWQGWSSFQQMLEEVVLHVCSFADGTSTVWFGQGMGAIVAYEVIKYIEKNKMQSPNLPTALIVSDCPAPHLFASTYKPYEADDWDAQLKEAKVTDKQRGIVTSEVDMMKNYKFTHEDTKKLKIPISAFTHEENKDAPQESVEAWADYAKEDGFEFVDPLDAEDRESYVTGVGYNFAVDPAVVSTVSELSEKTNWRTSGEDDFPDIGPTDGELPDQVDVLVVGAGIAGLMLADSFVDSGKSMIIVDRHHEIGGVWSFFANDYSRVNTSEIGFRFTDRLGDWIRPNEDHTPRREMMRDFYTIGARNKDKFRLGHEVTKCEPDGEGYIVTMRSVKTGAEKKVKCKVASFHVNRRLGERRDVRWENDDNFKGKIVYGYGNEVKEVSFWGKDCLIIGAGAFAFENVRTTVEHGAKFVTLLGRRDGTTCPKWIDMITFLRPWDESLMQSKVAAMTSFDAWQQSYKKAGLRTPACWDEGLLKPNNHTISVSDLAFIGGFHGIFTIKVGEIARITEDGHSVELKDGEKLKLDFIIKCTGFHLNSDVATICSQDKMYPFQMLRHNLIYSAEPLLDGGQFGAAKGNTEIDVKDTYSPEEIMKGTEILGKTWDGFDKKLFLPIGHPFGSGQGGPLTVWSKFLRWLVDNEDLQKGLIEAAGEPEMDVVNLWLSQIGKYTLAMTAKIMGELARD